MSDPNGVSTHYRACHLCEAMCGVAIDHRDGKVVAIRGDKEDTFSRGHICPKAVAIADLHEDPDRLRMPLRRRGRDWEEIDWKTAIDEVAARLIEVRKRYGRHSVAVYLGNPSVHNYGAALFGGLILPRFLRTKNRYSATSADQLPRMLVSLWLYGHQIAFPVPDLDRTDHLLILGANPVVSNGSIMTAPDVAERLKDIRRRGGRVVVVDPRRTETAALADEHHFIRPGRDALLLLGMLHTLFAENLVRPGRLEAHTDGIAEVRDLVARYAPEELGDEVGIPADTVRRLARDFAAAPSAVCYGRIGVCTQEFGALSTWLVDVLNLLTGNLDRPGGAMFPTPAADLLALAARTGQKGTFARYRSRVRGLPEFSGELPVATLADEMETPGDGQVRALLTLAGNPVLSTPNGGRLEKALEKLELQVALDLYVNETSKHAHYILPPVSPLEREQFDLFFHILAIRNTVRHAPAMFAPAKGAPADWQILLELSARLAGEQRFGWFKSAAVRAVGRVLTPERMVNLMIRFGPYGDRLNPFSKGLNLRKVVAEPHGIDLGPLQPRLPELLGTPQRRIRLAQPDVLADVTRLERRRAEWNNGSAPELMLIGRRQLRSNNSWMHNSERLVRGRRSCTLLMHPHDAEKRGLRDGQKVELRSRVGAIPADLEISDGMMPGVVSLPHGWGHDREGVRLGVARQHPGVSVNDVTDELLLDELSGNASFSGVPVSVAAVEERAPVTTTAEAGLSPHSKN